MDKADMTLATRLMEKSDLQQPQVSPSEVIVINADRDTGRGLNDVGKRIWEHLCEPREVDEICKHLTDELDANIPASQHETLEFLGALYDDGLSVESDDPSEEQK